MLKITILKVNFLLILLFSTAIFSQNTFNLDATTTSRFTVTDLVWPTNVGEADVCMWNDDKLAAFTISIDDNNEADVPFWDTMHTQYGFNFTWFLITEATSNQYNVQDWSLFNGLANTGNQINGHDDRNWYDNPTGGQTNPTPAAYLARLQATKTAINTNVTNGNNDCLTYAYPFGEGLKAQARTEFIAIRGVTGILNKADKVNYLDVNSISNVHIYDTPAHRDKYILPLMNTSATLFGSNYYRGWGSAHFHHVDAAAQTLTTDFLQYLQNKPNLWVAGFTEVSQYSQEFATHIINIDEVNTTDIKFTLTDDMLNAAFYFPLTVKIRIDNNWIGATATQNGASINTQLVTHTGNKYVLVNAVPDMGQVIISGSLDTDPPVLTAISDATMEEGTNLQIDFSASNTANDAVTLSASNLPSFATFTDNGDNSGNIVFSPAVFESGTYPNITVIATNGTSTDTETFELIVTESSNVVTTYSSFEDAAVYFPIHNFVDPNNRTFAIAGGGYVAGKQMSAEFPFLLPIKPTGQNVVNARFVVNLESMNASSGITGHLDLYGLDHRSSSSVLTSDGYAGNYDQDSNATGIQEFFADNTSTIGLQETTTTGNANLVTYINNQYNTAANNEFIFLRLSNSDVNQGQYNRILFTTADGAQANSLPFPTLFIEFSTNTSVNDEEKNRLHIYPNPSSGEISINLTDAGLKNTIDILIFNTIGQIVYNQRQINSNLILLSLQDKLQSGLYLMKISDDEKVISSKIIIE